MVNRDRRVGFSCYVGAHGFVRVPVAARFADERPDDSFGFLSRNKRTGLDGHSGRRPPLDWLLQERVRLAQRLLEQTDLPVQRIAERAGFGSTVALRRHFGDVAGTTPLAYRQTFRGERGR